MKPIMRRAVAFLFAFAGVASADVTYSKEVSRIIQVKCAQCHRPNDIAPFPLQTYDDVVTYRDDIQRVLSDKTMPPWKPVPGFGDFQDSWAISDDDRQTVLNWILAGTPQGDPADLPDPAPQSPSAWELGDPDLVLTMPEYTPPVRQTDTYRCFVLNTGLDANRFVSAIQVLPGARQITHHALLFVDETRESDKLDGQDGQPGYACFGGPNVNLGIGGLLGGWAPGARTHRLPDDIGVLLPKNARIVMQVHYHPSGIEAADQTRVGLYFGSNDAVQHRLVNIPIVNTTFKIPAGADKYDVTASLPVLPFLSGKAITVAPHMHLLGRQIKVEVTDRDGSIRPMIYIDNWDFNWQGSYTFVNPFALPAGSTVHVTATYDNSANNPRNPNNPIVPVGWGERTTDEMCLAFIGVIFDNESLLPLKAN